MHASRAHWSQELGKWVFEQGWQRSFRGSAIQSLQQFDASTFPNLVEPPGYFKKEVHQSQEMSSSELQTYIADLQQSGFDVVRLGCSCRKSSLIR